MVPAQERSLWSQTHTYFPLLENFIIQNEITIKRALLIGCADGHFIDPLLKFCSHLIAVEVDPKALYGDTHKIDESTYAKDAGVFKKYKQFITEKRLSVIEGNFLDVPLPDNCDLVFTSSSFHYSLNQGRLWGMVDKMITSLRPGGIFACDYMMPLNEVEKESGKFLVEGQLVKYLEGKDVQVLSAYYSEPYLEKAHAYVPYNHYHKMGYVIAVKS